MPGIRSATRGRGCVRRDLPPVGRQGATAVHQDGLQRIHIGKRAIHHRLIDQRPEALGRRPLRGGGWQEQPINPVRQCQLRTGVPAGLIEHPDGAVVGVNALVAGNGGQRQVEDGGGHGGQQAPPPLSGAGTPEALDSEPLGRAANRGTPGKEPDDRPMTARDRIARADTTAPAHPLPGAGP